jgi:hypothetical protein
MKRIHVIVAAGIFAMSYANIASAANFSRIESPVEFQLVQAKKDETVKQKVKRIWREWTGYKFDVACPAFPFPLTRTTCTTTGKNRDEARAKCQGSNPFCTIRDSSS